MQALDELTVKKISLVAWGANDEPLTTDVMKASTDKNVIDIFKSKSTEQNTMEDKSGAAKAQPTTGADLEASVKKAADLQIALDAANAKITELSKTAETAKTSDAITKAALDEVAKLSTKVIKLEEDARIADIRKDVTSTMGGLAGAKTPEIVVMLKSAEDKLGKDSVEYKTLKTILTSTSEIAKKSPMFKEVGNDGPADSSPKGLFAEKVAVMTAEIKKSATISTDPMVLDALAKTAATTAFPELAAEVIRQEKQEKARRMLGL